MITERKELEIVVIKVGTSYYGVDVAQILSIETNTLPVTNLAQGTEYVRGLVQHRGVITLVVNLSRVLCTDYTIQEKEQRKILIATINETITGFEVDEVIGIRRIRGDDIVEPTAVLLESQKIDILAGFINSSDTVDYILILLDLKKVIDNFKIPSYQ